jgi:hypothetical protein
VSSEIEEESCIPPVAKIAYPVIPASPGGDKGLTIGPLGGWRVESSLPEPLELDHASQILIMGASIWILPSDVTKIFQYDMNTQEWKIYTTINNYFAVPATLFITKDGTLWGIDTRTEDFASRDQFSLLSKYNEITDRFEFVKDTDSVLENVSPTSYPPYVAEDQNGLLWFFGSLPRDTDVNLYSFDPTSRKARINLTLSQPDWFPEPSLAIAKDGAIWFANGGPKKQLVTYWPDTHQLKLYSGLPNLNEIGGAGYLFFDRTGRLWLSNKGWLDFTNPNEPTWYEIIPSPVFLTDHGWFPALGDGLPSRYGWVAPYEISQTSNGWLWFTTSTGTIRLDLEKEEWCLFTTGISPVAEDENGNLWIVVFGKLYKYRLNP